MRLKPYRVRAIIACHVMVIVLLVYGNYMSAMGGNYDNINVSALTDVSLLFIQWKLSFSYLLALYEPIN